MTRRRWVYNPRRCTGSCASAVVIPAFNESREDRRDRRDGVPTSSTTSSSSTMPRPTTPARSARRGRAAPRPIACMSSATRATAASAARSRPAIGARSSSARRRGRDGRRRPDGSRAICPRCSRRSPPATPTTSRATASSIPTIWSAMPTSRIVGNVLLSAATRVTRGYAHVFDSQCGYTAIHRRALERDRSRRAVAALRLSQRSAVAPATSRACASSTSRCVRSTASTGERHQPRHRVASDAVGAAALVGHAARRAGAQRAPR